MKNLVFVGASVLLAVQGQIDGGECTYAVELLQLQDGSGSFQTHIESMTKFMSELVDTLHERYGEFKYGVSSFVDKPIAYSGFGNFGDWGDWISDYCYRHHAPLAEDATSVVKGLNELVGALGSGNDFPENPLEALMYAAADPEAQWSPVEQTHSPGGRPIVRIAMVITDDIPHAPIDAYSNTQLGWNWPRSYPNGPDGQSIGGFGAHNFATSVQINVNGENEALYYEMADLFRIFDNEGILSTAEEARLDELVTKFGPYPWPQIETQHPGDLSLDCAEVEYPTAEQVGDFLRPRNVLPIFLVARPQTVARPLQNACNALGFNPTTQTTDCLVEYYRQNATQMNLPAVVAAIDGDNTLDVIVDAVGALTDLLCLMPSTTTTPAPTTTELATTTQLVTTLPLETTGEATVVAEPTTVVGEPTTTVTHPTETENKTEKEDEDSEENNATVHPDASESEGDNNVTVNVTAQPDVSESDGDNATGHPDGSESDGNTEGGEDNHGATQPDQSEEDNNKTEEKPSITEEVPTEEEEGKVPASTEPTAVAQPSTEEVTASELEKSQSAFTLPAEVPASTEEDTEIATTEDEIVIIVPPPVEPPVTGGGEESSDGPSVGVIAGAAGGAVAGVAALAGLAYAKFGAGMFGGGAPAGMEGIQQVEVPDSPIERETMEEVTMDMFQ